LPACEVRAYTAQRSGEVVEWIEHVAIISGNEGLGFLREADSARWVPLSNHTRRSYGMKLSLGRAHRPDERSRKECAHQFAVATAYALAHNVLKGGVEGATSKARRSANDALQRGSQREPSFISSA
jgi:hypothetical protein